MSGSFPFYLKMALVGTVDLWTGSIVASLIERFFKDKGMDSNDPMERWTQNFLWASLQAVTTVVAGDQLRNLIYPPGFDDPTGGLIFMHSLFQPQPSLWRKVDYVLEGAGTIVPEIFKQEKNIIFRGEERTQEPKPYTNSIFTLGMGSKPGTRPLPKQANLVEYENNE